MAGGIMNNALIKKFDELLGKHDVREYYCNNANGNISDFEPSNWLGYVDCFMRWNSTDQGRDFWNKIDDEWEDILRNHEKEQTAVGAKFGAGKPASAPVVEEKPERKHAHYFKDVSDLDVMDIYAVCERWQVQDCSGATHHAIKKLLNAGQRGAKDQLQDLKEARDTISRKIEMIEAIK